jgi:glycosyltransferase involved in cell wall biosynthesis
MRVTVITPTKNQAHYIEDCLRSVHGQTHRDIEHIVLDGMSTDGTAEIVARYPCIFVQKRDSGPAQAINRGLDMAAGDIVCWLNSDDMFWSNTTIARIVDLFMEFSNVDVITGNGYTVDERGKLLLPIVPRPGRLGLYWMRRLDYMLQPATFWRRNKFRLDEELGYVFDWKLWIEFLQGGLSLLYVPEYFASYRMQASSLTYQDTAARKREVYTLTRRYGPRRAQIAWCWLVWMLYRLSEIMRAPAIKRFAVRLNGILSRATDESIVSG